MEVQFIVHYSRIVPMAANTDDLLTHCGSADDNCQSLAALFDTNVATEVKPRVDRRPA
jgi:hypothetical protein